MNGNPNPIPNLEVLASSKIPICVKPHRHLRAAQTAADREMYQRQIDATDTEIDALVYALYGLTEEEIRIVEGLASKE